jgi:hypothetical protein
MSNSYAVYVFDDDEGTRTYHQSFSDYADAAECRNELQADIDTDEDSFNLRAAIVEEEVS